MIKTKEKTREEIKLDAAIGFVTEMLVYSEKMEEAAKAAIRVLKSK